MIQKSDVVPLLLEACPGANAAWEEHLARWHGEEAGSYNDIAVFAHYLVECVQQGTVDCFPAVFSLVERMLGQGDEEVRSLASIGLLEDLQTIASWRPFGMDVFLPWLGPHSRTAWSEILAMWEGKHSLAEVLRAEREQAGGDKPSDAIE